MTKQNYKSFQGVVQESRQACWLGILIFAAILCQISSLKLKNLAPDMITLQSEDSISINTFDYFTGSNLKFQQYVQGLSKLPGLDKLVVQGTQPQTSNAQAKNCHSVMLIKSFKWIKVCEQGTLFYEQHDLQMGYTHTETFSVSGLVKTLEDGQYLECFDSVLFSDFPLVNPQFLLACQTYNSDQQPQNQNLMLLILQLEESETNQLKLISIEEHHDFISQQMSVQLRIGAEFQLDKNYYLISVFHQMSKLSQSPGSVYLIYRTLFATVINNKQVIQFENGQTRVIMSLKPTQGITFFSDQYYYKIPFYDVSTFLKTIQICQIPLPTDIKPNIEKCKGATFPNEDYYIYLTKFFYNLKGGKELLVQSKGSYYRCSVKQSDEISLDCVQKKLIDIKFQDSTVVQRITFNHPLQTMIVFFQNMNDGSLEVFTRQDLLNDEFSFYNELASYSRKEGIFIPPNKLMILRSNYSQEIFQIKETQFHIDAQSDYYKDNEDYIRKIGFTGQVGIHYTQSATFDSKVKILRDIYNKIQTLVTNTTKFKLEFYDDPLIDRINLLVDDSFVYGNNIQFQLVDDKQKGKFQDHQLQNSYIKGQITIPESILISNSTFLKFDKQYLIQGNKYGFQILVCKKQEAFSQDKQCTLRLSRIDYSQKIINGWILEDNALILYNENGKTYIELIQISIIMSHKLGVNVRLEIQVQDCDLEHYSLKKYKLVCFSSTKIQIYLFDFFQGPNLNLMVSGEKSLSALGLGDYQGQKITFDRMENNVIFLLVKNINQLMNQKNMLIKLIINLNTNTFAENRDHQLSDNFEDYDILAENLYSFQNKVNNVCLLSHMILVLEEGTDSAYYIQKNSMEKSKLNLPIKFDFMDFKSITTICETSQRIALVVSQEQSTKKYLGSLLFDPQFSNALKRIKMQIDIPLDSITGGTINLMKGNNFNNLQLFFYSKSNIVSQNATIFLNSYSPTVSISPSIVPLHQTKELSLIMSNNMISQKLKSLVSASKVQLPFTFPTKAIAKIIPTQVKSGVTYNLYDVLTGLLLEHKADMTEIDSMYKRDLFNSSPNYQQNFGQELRDPGFQLIQVTNGQKQMNTILKESNNTKFIEVTPVLKQTSTYPIQPDVRAFKAKYDILVELTINAIRISRIHNQQSILQYDFFKHEIHPTLIDFTYLNQENDLILIVYTNQVASRTLVNIVTCRITNDALSLFNQCDGIIHQEYLQFEPRSIEIYNAQTLSGIKILDDLYRIGIVFYEKYGRKMSVIYNKYQEIAFKSQLDFDQITIDHTSILSQHSQDISKCKLISLDHDQMQIICLLQNHQIKYFNYSIRDEDEGFEDLGNQFKPLSRYEPNRLSNFFKVNIMTNRTNIEIITAGNDNTVAIMPINGFNSNLQVLEVKLIELPFHFIVSNFQKSPNFILISGTRSNLGIKQHLVYDRFGRLQSIIHNKNDVSLLYYHDSQNQLDLEQISIPYKTKSMSLSKTEVVLKKGLYFFDIAHLGLQFNFGSTEEHQQMIRESFLFEFMDQSGAFKSLSLGFDLPAKCYPWKYLIAMCLSCCVIVVLMFMCFKLAMRRNNQQSTLLQRLEEYKEIDNHQTIIAKNQTIKGNEYAMRARVEHAKQKHNESLI